MQKKLIFNANIAVLLYFVCVILVWLILNSFNFILEIETETIMQKNVISFLGIYCYHGNFYSFWQMAVISLILLSVISLLIIFIVQQEYFKYIKSILFIQGLIHYFYWVFIHKYCPFFENQIYPHFYLSILYLFSLQIAEFLIIWVIKFFFVKFFKRKKSNEEIQLYTYKCPNCGKIFKSNVSFCPKCLKEIDPIEINFKRHS
ncbi:MAG: hypothetical protein ACTSWX_04240 [Promethearchaeota archaeon]